MSESDIAVIDKPAKEDQPRRALPRIMCSRNFPMLDKLPLIKLASESIDDLSKDEE
jgi:hypothetical protein